MSLLLQFLLIIIAAAGCFAQARSQRISTTCPNSQARAEIKILNGNIILQPCPTKTVIGLNLNNLAAINGQNFTTAANFNAAADYTTNTLTQNAASVQSFRLGSNKSFLENVQRPFGIRNEVRLRTDEISPPAGGFAEFWLISDNAHSYAYIRAQRQTFVRSDDFSVSNFFDDSKFRLFFESDNAQSHPAEDTSRFRVGNYTDQTNFLQISNIPGAMQTILAGVDGVFLRNKVHITQSQTPASSDACTTNQFVFDTNYIYICVATDTWKRAALSSY